jgi:hypothetical protein
MWRGFFMPSSWCVWKETHMKNEQALPGSIPPVIQHGHGCVLPAKPQSTIRPAAPKPATVRPKPEPTLEQRIADEVERRLNKRADNFLLGFIFGELLGSWFDKHNRK